ncbi:MAG TPA: ferritin family protein [Chloroflexota bacterium]
MGEANREALAALETAIQMEIEGNEFYVRAAEKVSWPEGKETLLDLAKDEQEHIRILKEEHASLLEGQSWLQAEKVTPRTGAKPLPVFEKNEAVIAGMVDDRADALDVLEVAINNEYKSTVFYTEQMKNAVDAQAKAVFAWLVKEEKTHKEILSNYAKYIGAQQEWLLEHERPILEG